jgi:hypothetical protein
MSEWKGAKGSYSAERIFGEDLEETRWCIDESENSGNVVDGGSDCIAS